VESKRAPYRMERMRGLFSNALDERVNVEPLNDSDLDDRAQRFHAEHGPDNRMGNIILLIVVGTTHTLSPHPPPKKTLSGSVGLE